MTAKVYFIPYLDGDWLGYGPLDPTIGYGLLPPDRDEILANLGRAVEFWKQTTDGVMCFGAHTGTYCRELFYEDDVISIYRDFVGNGGEIVVHPHEERVGAGHFIGDDKHMDFIITWKTQQLKEAGITPTALRIPYNGYDAALTAIAEKNGLVVDMSCAPNFYKEFWHSDWRGAPYSAFFLDYTNPADASGPPEERSNVLEVPMGCDGEGTTPQHCLFNEFAELDQLKRTWDAIVRRAESNGPQTVYLLSHLHAMADEELWTRLSAFLAYAQERGGVALTPSQAHARHAMSAMA